MKESQGKSSKEYESKTLSTNEMKRYLGVLNEQHTENLQAIREGFGVMDKRFERVDKRFERVDKRFDDIDKRFDKVDERLNSHTEMIGKLMIDVQIIKDDKVNY